jgi:hypothetical protein
LGSNRKSASRPRKSAAREAHQAKMRLTHARAQQQEIDSDIRQTIEAPLPGNMRIPFDTMKEVFSTAVRELNKA